MNLGGHPTDEEKVWRCGFKKGVGFPTHSSPGPLDGRPTTGLGSPLFLNLSTPCCNVR